MKFFDELLEFEKRQFLVQCHPILAVNSHVIMPGSEIITYKFRAILN